MSDPKCANDLDVTLTIEIVDNVAVIIGRCKGSEGEVLELGFKPFNDHDWSAIQATIRVLRQALWNGWLAGGLNANGMPLGTPEHGYNPGPHVASAINTIEHGR